MSVGLCMYGFAIDCAREEAVLVHMLHLHKKMRFLNSHCSGYEEEEKDREIQVSDKVLKILKTFV